jgi:hypothetical protein
MKKRLALSAQLGDAFTTGINDGVRLDEYNWTVNLGTVVH